VEDTIAILRGLSERYMAHHKVRIQDAALVAAAVLSARYVTGRFLPDKAIDLIDEAASKLRIEIDSMPTELDQISRRIRQLEIEKLALENAVRSWAAADLLARAAVRSIDRRRLSYVESLLRASGHSPAAARARAQILYWAFLGYAMSDKSLPRARQQAVLDELLRFASR